MTVCTNGRVQRVNQLRSISWYKVSTVSCTVGPGEGMSISGKIKNNVIQILMFLRRRAIHRVSNSPFLGDPLPRFTDRPCFAVKEDWTCR